MLEAVDDILAVLQAPFSQPRRAVLLKRRRAVVVIEDDEALDERALDQKRPQVRTWRRFQRVVVGNQAAQWNPRVDVQQAKDGREDGTADVFKIHIDARRTGPRQILAEGLRLVVDALIETELVDDVRALVC